MDLERAIRNNLTYYKKINAELKSKKARTSLTHMRRNFLQKEKVADYQREYDRVRGLLDHSLTGHMTQDLLIERKKTLEKLGAKIIDQIIN